VDGLVDAVGRDETLGGLDELRPLGDVRLDLSEGELGKGGGGTGGGDERRSVRDLELVGEDGIKHLGVGGLKLGDLGNGGVGLERRRGGNRAEVKGLGRAESGDNVSDVVGEGRGNGLAEQSTEDLGSLGLVLRLLDGGDDVKVDTSPLGGLLVRLLEDDDVLDSLGEGRDEAEGSEGAEDEDLEDTEGRGMRGELDQ
jgi:hypothetical protein